MLKAVVLTLLGFSACASAACAQNVEGVMDRANRLNQFMALFEHNDPSVRIAAFEEGVRASDPVFRKRAVEAGLISKDTEVRSMAILAHLKSGAMILLEVPDGVRLTADEEKFAKSQLPAQISLRSAEDASEDNFKMAIGSRGFSCRSTGGTLKCLGWGDIELSPAVDGLYTGKYNGVPIMYKYK